MDLLECKLKLEQIGIKFDSGLTDDETNQIEARYGFHFPPDYRDFLRDKMPVSNGFVNWRNGKEDDIRKMMEWPYDGMCYDIEHSQFWLREWGARPAKLADMFAIAKNAINKAPTLIPIFGHRYIPDAPREAGNPIFSVYQTDIIDYGRDLAEYLENEFSAYFFGESRYQITEPVKRIPFWSYIVDINNGAVDDGKAAPNLLQSGR